jgi:hypothetical protein
VALARRACPRRAVRGGVRVALVGVLSLLRILLAPHDEEERDDGREQGKPGRFAQEREREPDFRHAQGRLAEHVLRPHLPRVARGAVVAHEDVAARRVAGDDAVDDEGIARRLRRDPVGDDRAQPVRLPPARDDEVAVLEGRLHAVARDDHMVPRDPDETRLQRQRAREDEHPQHRDECDAAENRAEAGRTGHCG